MWYNMAIWVSEVTALGLLVSKSFKKNLTTKISAEFDFIFTLGSVVKEDQSRFKRPNCGFVLHRLYYWSDTDNVLPGHGKI